MAFLLPAFMTHCKAWIVFAFLCVIHLIVLLFYILYSGNSLSNFRSSKSLSLQNTSLTKNESKQMLSSMFRMNIKNMTTELPKCPETPPLLVGPLPIEFDHSVTFEGIRAQNSAVQPGGSWRPTNCIAQQKVAIIIPFRDRESHLKQWLHFLHPILQRQQLDYRVYIINQYGETTFNRAKLMNVGFTWALKQYDFDCFVFSDVDIVPMDDRNLFKCYNQPRHLSVALDKFGFRLPYSRIFGGVSAMTKEQVTKINGYPNNYWGWGGEDDDVSNRLSIRGMSISRPDSIIGRCRMIKHGKESNNPGNPKRFDYIAHTGETIDRDGLNSLHYQLLSVEDHPLYTNVTVNIGTP